MLLSNVLENQNQKIEPTDEANNIFLSSLFDNLYVQRDIQSNKEYLIYKD